MKKRKSRGLISVLLILIIVIGIVTGAFFVKESKNGILSPSENSSSLNENTSDKEKNLLSSDSDSLSKEEKEALESYTDKICNTNLNNRLPEFNDINDAYKPWIYSHITRSDDIYCLTENEIKNDLQAQFGADLKIEIEKDVKSYDDVSMPEYDEATGKYALPLLGMDHSICYAVNTIEKSGNQYIVNVIEYNILTDLTDNQTVLSAYDDNTDGSRKWKEIFRTDSPASEEESKKINEQLKNMVINRKNEFQCFNLTIEKNNDNSFIIKKSEKA